MSNEAGLETAAFAGDVSTALQEMGAMRPIRSFLKERHLTTGRSWTDILLSIHQHLDLGDLNRDDLASFVVDLRARLKKQLSIYSVEKTHHARLWQWATALIAPVSDVAQRFPFGLPGNTLEATLGTSPELVFARRTDHGIEVFFSSVRVGMRLDEILIEDIAAEVQGNYVNADHMYAERIDRVQAFDVLFVPERSHLIQTRIDMIATTNRDRGVAARGEIERIAIEGAKLSAANFAAMNVFPAVRSIYIDVDEGRLTGLQFDCSTGTNRREMMRRIKGDENLRDEAYHIAGSQQVDVSPYWLEVQLEDPPAVEITLPGTLRNLNDLAPLTTFEVGSFPSEDAISHAVDVLVRHAGPATAS